MDAPQTVFIACCGADWLWLKPLLDAGELPVLARLMERGAVGSLKPLPPHAPEMLAATLATGLPPDRHRVLGRARDGRCPRVAGRAIWAEMAAAGDRVAAVGWPVLEEVEAGRGVVVTDEFAKFGFPAGSEAAEGPVFPKAAGEWLAELRMDASEVDPGLLGFLLPTLREQGRPDDTRPGRLLVHLARLYSTHNAAVAVLGRERPEFFSVYYGFLGDVAREFGMFHPPRHAEAGTWEFALYRDVMRGAARIVDALLGDLLAGARPGARVVVASTWGLATGEARPSRWPRREDEAAEWRARPGVWVAAGPGVAVGRILPGASLMDIAPTLLAWRGVAVPESWPGRVVMELFATPTAVAKRPDPEAPSPLAVPDFAKAAEPAEGREALALGRALRELGRTEDALPWLQRAYLTEPEDAIRTIELAQTLCHLTCLDEAEPVVASIRDHGDESPAACHLLALRAGARGEWAEARARIDALGDTAAGRELRGEWLLRTGRAAEAREAWLMEAGRTPGNLRAWIGATRACLQLADRVGAADALGRARQLDPTAKAVQALDKALAKLAEAGRGRCAGVGVVDWSERFEAAEARMDAGARYRARAAMFFDALRSRSESAAVAEAAGSGELEPARWVMRAPRPDELERVSRHFSIEAPEARTTNALWRRVLVAGSEERVVGIAHLSAAADPPGASQASEHDTGSGHRLHLRFEVRKAWRRGAAADALFNAAMEGARSLRAQELMLVVDDEEGARRARAHGFELVVRKEMRRVSVDGGLAWFEGRGARLVAGVGVEIAPLDQADPLRVKAICETTRLLSGDRVFPERFGQAGGYDPGLSFFAGTREAPVAVLLAREHGRGVYLEALARDPDSRDGVRGATLLLFRELLRAARSRGHTDFYGELTPARTPGLGQVTDRWQSVVAGVWEKYRWRRPSGLAADGEAREPA